MVDYVLETKEDTDCNIPCTDYSQIRAIFKKQELSFPKPLIASEDGRRFPVIQKIPISGLDLMVLNTELSYFGYNLKGPFKPGEAAEYWKFGELQRH